MADARIDGGRLLDRLAALAVSAPADGGGVTRLAWSPEDDAAKALLAGWVGVPTRQDAVGNLIAELPGVDPSAAPLASGSHLDTVVGGGALDGAYGTLAAFEALACLAEGGERLRHPLRVVAWANEEGVVAPPFTGSRAAAGHPVELPPASPGPPAPGGPAGWPRLAGYLELHVEQGPVLEAAGARIGVVTGITGLRRGWLTVEGRANHAGTTPMHLRHDALAAAAHAVLALQSLAVDGPAAVATAGAVEVRPGNANVVAGWARVSYDVRHLDEATLDGAMDRLDTALAGIAGATGTTVTRSPTSASAAVPTDPLLRRAIGDAAAGLGLPTLALPSGAGHDAQHVAALGPVGMIFVPSIGGVSHNPAESTAPEDLVAGAQVLLDALRRADRLLP